jgi:hypothetical protein
VVGVAPRDSDDVAEAPRERVTVAVTVGEAAASSTPCPSGTRPPTGRVPTASQGPAPGYLDR